MNKTKIKNAYKTGLITLVMNPANRMYDIHIGKIRIPTQIPATISHDDLTEIVTEQVWHWYITNAKHNPDVREAENYICSNVMNYAEIRCDYETDENILYIDAWKTDDDNEEGQTIAYIDTLTGRVIYRDVTARYDRYAQEIIRQKVDEINAELANAAPNEKAIVPYERMRSILVRYVKHNAFYNGTGSEAAEYKKLVEGAGCTDTELTALGLGWLIHKD